MSETLPPGWTWTTLGEIAIYINGRAFKPSEWSKEGLPIIRIQNLNRGGSDFNYCNFPVDEKFYVAKGDLLFGWSGTPDTSFGAHIWNGGRGVLNQHIFRIVVDDRLLHKQYFLHALNHKVKEFVSKAHGTAGLAHITKRKFEESQISIPPLPEQHRIVEKIEALFSELDKGVEQLKTAAQQLKVYRQSVLKWAFEGKLTEGWRTSQKSKVKSQKVEIAEALLERIKREREALAQATGKKLKPIAPLTEKELAELPRLPEGWAWVRFGDVADIKGGKRLPKGETYSEERTGYPYIRVVDFDNYSVGMGSLKYLKARTQEKINAYTIGKDDVYISIAGTIGVVGTIPEVLDGANLTENAAKIVLPRSLTPKYISFFLSSYDGQSQVGRLTMATTQPKLALFRIAQIAFPLCASDEQHQIVQEIETRLSVCDKLEESITASLQQAEALRQSILKKAFEGKLVSQDQNDEPASVLLETIRNEKAAEQRDVYSTKRKRISSRGAK